LGVLIGFFKRLIVPALFFLVALTIVFVLSPGLLQSFVDIVETIRTRLLT